MIDSILVSRKFKTSLRAAVAVIAALSPMEFPSEVLAAPANKNMGQTLDTAYFAAGCFWKPQFVFNKIPGVVHTEVGYTGGTLKNPTYEQVCNHTTGHAEAVKVEYDPAKTTYRKLLETFFAIHDPTTLNRQSSNVGDQYRSAIFYVSEAQKREALAYEAQLKAEKKFAKPIVTLLVPSTKFYKAETYHQNYYARTGYVCE